MPLVHMADMLQHAYENNYAVGAFDVVSLDFIAGVMAAAEEKRAPVIISLAESHFGYFDFELLMASVVKAAERATIPVAIHLDHGESIESAVHAVNLGCTGIMVDASNLTLDKNISLTKSVVDMAHACGIPVEGELGYVPGVEGEDAERHPGDVQYTTVDEARRYIDGTGADFLAVSIGTVHGRMKGEPNLDIGRLSQINQALKLPLVIHGGTGLRDDQYRSLIDNGVAKINYYTALADSAGQRIKGNAENDVACNYTSQLNGVVEAVQQEAGRCIDVWGCAGRASPVLTSCRTWLPIEHVIFFNTEKLDAAATEDMMSEGRRVLGSIPGVQRVFTGHALAEDASYSHCWLVRFSGRPVIDSYREHTLHQYFADNRFRPYAGDRLSIDFEECCTENKT
jgi:fructose-bisphosphate aldolase class II